MKQQLPPSHDRLCSECFLWFYNTYPQHRKKMFHVANETPRFPGESYKEHQIRLAKRKAIGVVPGVMDLLWYTAGKLIAFDIKIDNDKMSEDQLAFGAAIIEEGGQWYEIRSLEQFKNIVSCSPSTSTVTP